MDKPGENIIDGALAKKILRKRDPGSHKGNYGHACLVAGSYGMMGAAVLAATACLRSGAGKLTCYIPSTGFHILQSTVPEAMVKDAGKKVIQDVGDLSLFTSLGIGPGLTNIKQHASLLEKIFSRHKKPVVIDADGLNVIAGNKGLLKKIPAESILTPHQKEFERLFRHTEQDFERTLLALEISSEYKIYLVIKGHRTLITTPDKKVFLNSTGNAGMATAGSGDVLTGIITGLSAQGYSSEESCLLGVYVHGLAGDIAAAEFSETALIAGDINKYLGYAFKQLEQD